MHLRQNRRRGRPEADCLATEQPPFAQHRRRVSVYPLTTLLRIVVAQLLVLFFCR
jgi:hypothetical protein